ncbi:hypothetical protein DL765_010266 [Monosporascus sp. GIB2]|nr:hypothetical protein DL765_010266 [Monosporascus sp. GIB2]
MIAPADYVFVDEHNRHKRLKVMRACEGCRRRKIKCDAATTNTWPCSACIRLKLHCVRPNAQYDGSPTEQYESSRSEYEAVQIQDNYRQMAMPQQQSMMGGQPKMAGMYTSHDSYTDPHGVYPSVHYGDAATAQHNVPYSTVPSVGVMDQQYAPAGVFPTPPVHHQSVHSESSPESYQQDHYGQHDISDVLGALKLDERGTAILNHEEEPAVEDVDDFKGSLPPLTTGPGLKIRIPPELMPDEETILHYFDLYFANVHPYVPVLNKPHFYHQWHNNRESISPLLLEAIFAVAGRLADEPAQGQQWIALASNVPRLSTLQAQLIILKAREAVPKRGYYYRSWISVVNCVAMAKDLGLNEHFEDHQAGKPCGSTPAECLTKTRIWQTIFVCETMIAASQGRNDLAVDLETIDFSIPRHIPGCDDSEYHVSRNFVYLTRIVRTMHRMIRAYGKIRRRKDWGLDPELTRFNPSLTGWLDELPADLAISFPADGSPPWLPSHFIGNLHSYHYLSIVVGLRPQLSFLDPNSADGQWKSQMMLSYSSAKALCRIQESMLQTFGLSGLRCMQRGISFTIYAILACLVLHLVALTSPDPDLNTDARDYFTRHMRLLEKTMDSWPLPEMIKQIDAVREAFSADTRKPFVLKPSFPYGSPATSNLTSPPRATTFKPPMLRTTSLDHNMDSQADPHSQVSYMKHPITPISAASGDNKSDSSPAVQPLVMMPSGQSTQASQMSHGMPLPDTPPNWNPSRIFDQWNTTFGAPELQTNQDMQIAAASMPSASQPLQHQQYSAAPVHNFVTPAMWRESVASVYEGGLKRGWDYESTGSMAEAMSKSR